MNLLGSGGSDKSLQPSTVHESSSKAASPTSAGELLYCRHQAVRTPNNTKSHSERLARRPPSPGALATSHHHPQTKLNFGLSSACLGFWIEDFQGSKQRSTGRGNARDQTLFRPRLKEQVLQKLTMSSCTQLADTIPASGHFQACGRPIGHTIQNKRFN